MRLANANIVNGAITLGNELAAALGLGGRSDIHSFTVYWPADEDPRVDVRLAPCTAMAEIGITATLPLSRPSVPAARPTERAVVVALTKDEALETAARLGLDPRTTVAVGTARGNGNAVRGMYVDHVIVTANARSGAQWRQVWRTLVPAMNYPGRPATTETWL